jgi:hypothetical protein
LYYFSNLLIIFDLIAISLIYCFCYFLMKVLNLLLFGYFQYFVNCYYLFFGRRKIYFDDLDYYFYKMNFFLCGKFLHYIQIVVKLIILFIQFMDDYLSCFLLFFMGNFSINFDFARSSDCLTKVVCFR